LAVQRWGEQRVTTDVDFTLLTTAEKEQRFINALLGRFRGRIPDAREFALRTRVVLCRASNGIDVDIALGGMPYEERVIQRASRFKFAPRMEWITASAEDLVIMKVVAGRELDWHDVRRILQRQWPKLNWKLIERELPKLLDLKEDWNSFKRFQSLRKEVERELRRLNP
jgi:hypothetical protein